MKYLSELYVAVPQEVQLPQVTLPQPTVLPQATDTIRSQQLPRPVIQLIDPALSREVPERFQLRPQRATPPPPPELSAADSIDLNLVGNTGMRTNWEVKFNLLQPFDETDDGEVSEAFLLKHQPAATDTLQHTLEGVESPASRATEIITHVTQETETELPARLQEHQLMRSDWFIALLIVSVLVTGIVKKYWARYLNDLLQSLVFPSQISRLSTTNASNFQPSLILGVLFYFNSSLFLFQFLEHTNRTFVGLSGAIMLPLLFVFLVLLFVGNTLAYRVVGRIFGTSGQIHDYLSGSSAMSKAFGLFLLPIILFMPFVEPDTQLLLIKGGIGMFIMLYLIQITRGIHNNLTNIVSGYYIILYLCALEILPLSVLFKVLFK